jgi:hypothetical protein
MAVDEVAALRKIYNDNIGRVPRKEVTKLISQAWRALRPVE